MRGFFLFVCFFFFLEEQQFSQLLQLKHYSHLFKYFMVTPMNTLVTEMLSEASKEQLSHCYTFHCIIVFQHSSEINCIFIF